MTEARVITKEHADLHVAFGALRSNRREGRQRVAKLSREIDSLTREIHAQLLKTGN